MFFSVSMPIYNAAPFLDESISAVLEQSEQDFELILVDDGSQDESLAVCKKWEERHPDRIRVVTKENSGSLLTRRRCLQESRGEYLYVIDADDRLLHRDVLKIIRETIEKTGCDLVFFNLTVDPERAETDHSRYPFADGEIFSGERKTLIYRFYLEGGGLKSLCTKVFHRSLVDWDEDYEPYRFLTNGTDFFQSTPLVSRAQRLCYLNRTLYYYRFGVSNSIVQSFKPAVYESARANLLRVYRFSENWNLDPEERWRLVSTACMKMVSTSAKKILQNRDPDYPALAYLKTIGEDSLFREFYSLAQTPGARRRLIVFLLYHRQYRLLLFLLERVKGA